MIEIIEFVFHFLFKVSGLNPRDSCNLTGCGSGLFFTIFFCLNGKIITSTRRLCFHLCLLVCLSVCVSVARISQKVLDRCSCTFVHGRVLGWQQTKDQTIKVATTSMGILNICNLWILLGKIVIYPVGRKCHLHGLFCC